MTKFVILTLIILIILIIVITFLYFVSRNKQQALQVITLQNFMSSYHSQENEIENKSFLDTIKDFFNDNDGIINGIDNEDNDDGGDDGGE